MYLIIFLLCIVIIIEGTFIKTEHELIKKVKIKKFDNKQDFILPYKASESSAAFDLYATSFSGIDKETSQINDDSVDTYIIAPGETIICHTNIVMEIPEGYYLDICSRSGLSIKNSVFVVNSPARIDSDYRGEILVGLKNLSTNTPFVVNKLERVAQCTLHRLIDTKFEVTSNEFSKTNRGNGGLGHSGKN